MTTRASIQLTLSGTQDQIDCTVHRLAEHLTEAGYFFDEDFTSLHGPGWCLAGLELRTAGAIRTALDCLPRVGARLVETNPELLT